MTSLSGAGVRGRWWRNRRRPPAHGFALVLLLTALALMLTTDATLGARRAGGRASPVGPPALRRDGQATGGVLDLAGSSLRTARGDLGQPTQALVLVGVPPRPELRRLLAAARRSGATGTWFVDGRTVAERADDVRRIRAAGFELGVTGWSGRDLRDLPPWRLRLELSAAQAALADRVGITAPLLLLPRTPREATIDGRGLRAARAAAGRGYVLAVGASDEGAPGAIVVRDLRDVTPPAGRRAVRTLLPSSSWRTVSEVTGLRAEQVNRAAPAWTRLNARVVLATIAAADVVHDLIYALFFPVTALIALRTLVAAAFAVFHATRERRLRGRPAWRGPVTVVVPAYNEEAGIEPALRSIAASDWPHGVEVIVVDDGSTDGTAELVRALDLPGVTLVRQQNSGKPAALDHGTALAQTDVVVFVDGDTLFQRDTIGELVAPFADPQLGAVSGNAKVLNRRALLGRWQHIEYVMGFNLDRRLLDVVHAIPTVPGAVGAFRRAALADVGGVSDDTLAEDTDLTIALARRGWRVRYQPTALAWTEAPSSLSDLWRQRYRWSYGTMQAAWKHRGALVERRAIGPVGLTYALLFQVLLALLGPVLDVAALSALLSGERMVAALWLAFTALQLALAALAFTLDGESWRPLWALPLQQVLYRQLMYLVVIQSLVTAVSGTRLRWHKLRRIGLEGHGVEVGVGGPPSPEAT